MDTLQKSDDTKETECVHSYVTSYTIRHYETGMLKKEKDEFDFMRNRDLNKTAEEE